MLYLVYALCSLPLSAIGRLYMEAQIYGMLCRKIQQQGRRGIPTQQKDVEATVPRLQDVHHKKKTKTKTTISTYIHAMCLQGC